MSTPTNTTTHADQPVLDQQEASERNAAEEHDKELQKSPKRKRQQEEKVSERAGGPHQRNSNLEMSLNLSLMIQKQSQKKKKMNTGFDVIPWDVVRWHALKTSRTHLEIVTRQVTGPLMRASLYVQIAYRVIFPMVPE